MAAPRLKNMVKVSENNKFVFETSYKIYYKTENPVPIKQIISSLQGLEGVIKYLPAALTNLTGVEIQDSEFLIQSIEAGSLWEEIFVKLTFGSKDKLDAFLEKTHANKPVRNTIIGVALLGLVGYGMHLAASASKTAAPNITATNSVIIQNGAGVLNLTPEVVQQHIQAAVKDKKYVAESAVRFIAPARAEPEATISVGDAANFEQEKIEISSKAIKETPARLELEPNERVEVYKNTRLQIRALNMDSHSTGWKGKLSNREDTLPIVFAPEVDISRLFGVEVLVVDADLVFAEKGKSRELQPKRIYVHGVHPPSTGIKVAGTR